MQSSSAAREGGISVYTTSWQYRLKEYEMNRFSKSFGVCLLFAAMMAQSTAQSASGGKHMQAKGTFVVKVTPAEPSGVAKSAAIGRYTLEKTFSGDLEGSAEGEMLSSATESTGAMAYVAMDHVTGTLNGRKGDFYLMHSATMKKGDASSGVMKIVVVKDSGTGELAGIRGELTIIIDGKGGHSYVFDYELP